MSVMAEKLVAQGTEAMKVGELSFFSYIWKCVIGAEAVYFTCLLYAAFVLEGTPAGTTLHHTLFETLPGFVWLTPASVVLGAIYFAVFAVIFGAYIVWMHNSSIQE